jgi:hypothetical protein
MNHSTSIIPRWLTLKGAAIYSGLSERTIENSELSKRPRF